MSAPGAEIAFRSWRGFFGGMHGMVTLHLRKSGPHIYVQVQVDPNGDPVPEDLADALCALADDIRAGKLNESRIPLDRVDKIAATG